MHLRKSFMALMAVASLNAWAEFKALPPTPPIPVDNPQTPAKIELGKQLYFDPRISADGSISCNSCHNVMSHGADGRPVGAGIHGKRGGRGSPTVWNSAYHTVQFWDGREASLEGQAKGPMTNPVEMGMDNHDIVISRIKQIPGYVEAFKKVFPKDKEINIDNVAKAIASYERTLITPNSPFDKYMKGNKKAMTAQQIRGMKLVDEIGCTSCHTGVNFAGDGLKMGEGNYQPFPQIPGSKYDKQYDLTADLGRYEVTKKAEDKNHWRVPTWRNIALTAPYFHNGKVQTLDEAVRVMAKTQLDMDLTDAQTADIVAFMHALTGEIPRQTMPILPHTLGTTLTPDP
ncbi:cytochrome-c peroxidase [Peredibacter sp. HCB2-198]|uniref:cytochrome-c peroxidase n=1 Tax=Peredibacter sp. HCB2-198 TaxID=3383025 RepID=UPI0038B4CDF2